MQTVIEKTTTKTDFVAALRSGNYEQLCDGRLFDGTGRTCAMMVWHKLNGDNELAAYIGGNSVFGLANAVYDRIAELNDQGYTFGELAMIIQETVSDDLQSISY
jgi:hypothetical protein